MFTLKNYQEQTLQVLENYLQTARILGAKAAFNKVASENSGVGVFRDYQPLNVRTQETPYVCLRLPTGGGKTLLATYAIQKAAHHFMDTDFPFVLWVVPTSTIKDQTLNALRTAGHPYREALENNFDNRFRVLDISEFNQIRPQDLKGKANIVLSTFAAYRVDGNNEEKRKVYAHHEDLEPHFSGIFDSDNELDRNESGQIINSFINLLHLHRPLMIIDEAHNHRSDLSVSCIEKINPSCIIELTATPAKDSNILHNVSASELKAENMIKLPIELTEHDSWQEAIHASVQARQKLQELSLEDKDYIRPIVLIQAEKKNQDVTVEVIENFLVEDEKIDRSKIAIATGEQRELDGINLLDRDANIEFVITVEALKEGWDCSFAYILCSVANTNSPKNVEQLLGRVLRMPYAECRQQTELNRAYAFVSSSSWSHAATKMHDHLVEMGFDEKEALENIRQQRPRPQPELALNHDFALELPICSFSTEKNLDLSNIPTEERSKIEVRGLSNGLYNISIKGALSLAVENVIAKTLKGKSKEIFKKEMVNRRYHEKRQMVPSVRGVPFAVSELCFEYEGKKRVVKEDLYMERGWRLSDFPAELPQFKIKKEHNSYLIDIQGNRVVERFSGSTQTELDLDSLKKPWSEDFLVSWLARHLKTIDLNHSDLCLFIRKTIQHLRDEREINYAIQQRFVFLLSKAFENQISEYRNSAYKTGYQTALFSEDSLVCHDEKLKYEFKPTIYPAHTYYSGSYQFNKHYFPSVAELKSEGEEFECAKILDQHPDVEFWVRNLESRDSCAFSLPVSTGRFYPDFIAKLNDGRTLIVEYKGAHLVGMEKEKEKSEIGKLWEQTSNKTGLFLFALKKDAQGNDIYQQIKNKILQ